MFIKTSLQEPLKEAIFKNKRNKKLLEGWGEKRKNAVCLSVLDWNYLQFQEWQMEFWLLFYFDGTLQIPPFHSSTLYTVCVGHKDRLARLPKSPGHWPMKQDFGGCSYCKATFSVRFKLRLISGSRVVNCSCQVAAERNICFSPVNITHLSVPNHSTVMSTGTGRDGGLTLNLGC